MDSNFLNRYRQVRKIHCKHENAYTSLSTSFIVVDVVVVNVVGIVVDTVVVVVPLRRPLKYS
jgi:hypothetical protein